MFKYLFFFVSIRIFPIKMHVPILLGAAFLSVEKLLVAAQTACSVPAPAPTTTLTGCGIWSLDSCSNGASTYPAAGYDDRKWQTPSRTNGSYYVDTFQDFRELTGYADITYNADRTSATVTVHANVRSCTTPKFKFGSATATETNTFDVDTSFTGALDIVVTAPDANATLTLEPLYFVWDKPAIDVPQTKNGQKVSIVELFGWPYADVAKECEFLGKAGWAGVKIFPSQEHVSSTNWYEPDGQFNPWYHLYQPVSYRQSGRMGTREDLRNMIITCRNHGVRVYADAVVNHMTGGGNDIQLHRDGGCNYWTGHNASDGSPYFTHSYTYVPNESTGARPAMEYPAVPYGPTDFHCEKSLNSWTDPNILSTGWLVGLADLNTGSDYVRNRIAAYMVDLLSLGFSGFRVDAAKHISPDDHAAIFGLLNKKMGGSLPDDFISWLEVILGGEKDLLACQDSSYNFYTYLSDQLAASGISTTDVEKIKIWSSDYPKEFPACGSWVIPATRFVIQNDDHDQQTSGSSSRDMGSAGSVLIVSKDVATHRAFEVQLFNRTDGDWNVRNVLSSYSFMNNGASGFPDGYSDCARYTGSQSTTGCKSMKKAAAYVADACGYSVVKDGTWQEGAYTRVHRDLSIINAMRGWLGYNSTTLSVLGLPSTCS
ncbi:glycoside hydrolase superfamily [Gongronella butleri]|nr:glycoside hydrolase superfamily [Gongronella butleri]